MHDENSRLRQALAGKIEQLATKDFLPPELVRLVGEVALLLHDARGTCRVELAPDAELARADAHAQGRPILPAADFPCDLAQAGELLGPLLDLLEGVGGKPAEAALVVRAERDAGRLDFAAAAKAFMAGDESHFRDFAGLTPHAPMTVPFLIQAGLTPSLEAVAALLAPRHEAKEVWRFGHCPICGRPPLISDLRDKEGVRFMSCSFCHSAYRVPRIGCPFCGETDQKQLGFFEAEEEPGFRVETCKTCTSYIKTADMRKLDRMSLPLLDDLDSLALDLLAAREGFTRPTLSGWGF